MDKKAFIVCENMVKIYKIAELETVALQGLDLVVEKGEMLGVVGPSGSGKSTLMNILGGLDRPSAGRVWVDGQDLLKLNDAGLDRYRQTKVGFVWQQSSRNLVPYLNAVENVMLPMTLAGKNVKVNQKKAEEILDRVKISNRMYHRMEQLSGGEQQRVAIAVSLANEPTMLLADEPTGEVDSTIALQIYQTFRDLNRDLGVTIIIVSHDMQIAHHVDRVVAIRDGKTATETVRRPSINNHNGENGVPEVIKPGESLFEELIVLDSAGRLQIPKDYLESYAIKGRVRLEKREDGILILPASQTSKMAETVVEELDISSGTQKWKRNKVVRAVYKTGKKGLHLLTDMSTKVKGSLKKTKSN